MLICTEQLIVIFDVLHLMLLLLLIVQLKVMELLLCTTLSDITITPLLGATSGIKSPSSNLCFLCICNHWCMHRCRVHHILELNVVQINLEQHFFCLGRPPLLHMTCALCSRPLAKVSEKAMKVYDS